jgi:hypothetical protein
MKLSPEVAQEIARLMRDPNSMQAEAAQMRRATGRGHYDPNQPRVPAGDPKGGQFASKGYRGGDLGRDAGATRASFDGTQLAQLGPGNPGDAYAQVQPFDGLFGEIDAGQHLNSRRSFIQLDRDHTFNPRSPVTGFPAGRFEFLSTRPPAYLPLPNGARWTLTATTYGRDPATGAYVTIRATPERPVVIQEIDGVVTIERR